MHDEGPARKMGTPRGPSVREASTGRRQVVLLVEDTDADRDMYGGLLWYNGYEVVHAADGETAVARALEVQPDLILMDLMLPGGMDGIETSRRLRRRGLDAPIVALSARSEAELGATARSAGIDAYLEKPIDPFSVVKEVMRRIGYARPADDVS